MRIRGLLPSTVLQLLKRRSLNRDRNLHVFLCVADHWEPKYNRPPRHIESERVARWAAEYPIIAQQYHDCIGNPPQHTFFYPAEEYEPEHLERVASICRRGFGDVEVHLHHDRDTAAGLRDKLESFTKTLYKKHGLLRKDGAGRIRYGFIHGNWALDNSRPDGRWCGVDNEITVLIETGCYADFTMPSAPSACQTSTINSIYYALDDPQRPMSHDQGISAQVGTPPPTHSLLMIQGPLALDWRSRKWGIMPRLENGDLTGRRPPSMHRFQLWMQAGVTVEGRDDWLFVKLHTHGTQTANADMLLGQPMRTFHQSLKRLSQENPWLRYYYVTANDMGHLVDEAVQGCAIPSFAWRHSTSF